MARAKPPRYWLYELDNRSRGELYIFAVATRLTRAVRPKAKELGHWRKADRLELRGLGQVPAGYVARLLRRYAGHLRSSGLKVLVGPAPRLTPSRGKPS